MLWVNEAEDDPPTPNTSYTCNTNQIVTRENLTPSCGPIKKINSPRGLNSPNTFPRNDGREGTLQLIIMWTDIKFLILLQFPSHAPFSAEGVLDSKIWRKSTTKSNSQSFRSRMKCTYPLVVDHWLSCCLEKQSPPPPKKKKKKFGEVSVKVEYKAMVYTASGKLWVKSPFENKIFQ